MEFRLLGPLEVVEGDRSLALGGHKQRSLLAVLLLHANEVVSSERLIDDLWGEAPPATVAKSIQVYVSGLRKQLGERRLVTRTPGYVLRVDPSELDAARFERLIAEARSADPGRAAEKLREALALWRAPPLADLAYEPFAQAEIARLEELHLGAVEQRIDADLATGRHADVVAELEALIGRHPLRESLRGQLMLALYRSGRQAEALETYQAARSALIEELGIEPSRRIRELHQAILVQDPSLDLDPRAHRAPSGRSAGADGAKALARLEPAEQGRATGVFVGREGELAELVRALEDALAGRGRLVLVAGEPGIGKSRLTDELIGQARMRGARVLVGRCWEAGGAPAYWPWVQSLRSYVRETEPEALQSQLGVGAADLAQLLPELRELFPALPEPAVVESEGARFRLFEAASSFLRRAAEARPLVLVLDDLHAADEPSLLLLRFLAREIADSPLLVVCAFRDVDPALRDPLTSALAQLAREPQTGQITLAGLHEPDVAEYIQLATGTEAATTVVQAIHTETDGNPLFVVEVVRLLDAERRIAEGDADVPIPPGVRAVIGQRLRQLSEPCRNLLAAASVIGREFGLDALARLGDVPRDPLLDLLDEAMAERIVGDVPGSPGRLRFGHALIRDTLYDELTPARRLRLHQQAGEALEAVYAADLEPHFAELARHFFAAAPAGAADQAIAYARRAGDRAAHQLAYEEAARHYEMALTLVDEPMARCELLLGLGDARARAGDMRASKDVFHEAAELAERHDLPEHLARAALGYGGRIFWEVSRDDDRLLSLLERALAKLGREDSDLRVRLLARLAGGPLRDASFPPERRAALSEEALAAGRRLGDPATLAYAIHGYILGHQSPEHTRGQLEVASELIAVAAQAGDHERVLEGREERMDALLELGDMSAAKAELEAMARLAQKLRQPAQDWLVTEYRALFGLLEGRLAEAEGWISEAHSLGERAQSWNAAVTYRLQLYVLRREQGRLEEIEDLVRRSVVEYPTYPIWRCVLAQIEAELGHAGEARDTLDALAADRFASLPFDEEWLVSIGLLAETARVLGGAGSAAILYELLLPYGDRVAVGYPEISTGAVARYLGLLATTMERWDDAERHLQDALKVNARIGARPWLAHTQHDYARMLLSRNATGDTEQAQLLASTAVATYRDLGMHTYEESASALTL
jgi:DNA-binding SARP family transcriptional activator